MRNVFLVFLALFSVSNVSANDTWQNATVIDQDTTVSASQNDDDWYELTISDVQAVKRLLIDLVFTHADGNIDIEVYGDDFVISDPAGPVPGLFRDTSAGTTSDDEFIDHNVDGNSPDTYYILVSGDNLGNAYSLTWTEIISSTDDGFEQNDTRGSSTAITEDTVLFGLQSDDDWYSIQVAPGQRRVLGSLRFFNTELAVTIDLNMELTDASGTVIATSAQAAGNNESIEHVVDSPGSYHLRIYGDDNRDGYALDWSGTNEPPQATANTVSTTEDIPYSFVAGDFTFTDSEGDSLASVTLSNLSLGGGTLTHTGGTAVNGGDTLTSGQLDTLVYTPAAGATGSPLATFDFTVNDADTGTASAQMDIDVTAAAVSPAPAPASSGGGGGAFLPAWLLALVLAWVFSRNRY